MARSTTSGSRRSSPTAGRGRLDHRRLFAEHRGCRYLVERYTVAYAPSLRVAAAGGRGAKRRMENVLVLADPEGGAGSATEQLRTLRSGALPSARVEAAAIRRRVGPAAVTVLEGAEATERAFARESGSADVLHLAAHAWVEENSPLFSAVRLAAGGGGDGLLEAHEMMAMDLRGKLAVLSACETAGGPVRRGEGIESLARVFLLAGADAVIASLWRVDDSTARLMERFYRELEAGHRPAEALRRAKVALLRDLEGKGYTYALPYFWASFVLYGELP